LEALLLDSVLYIKTGMTFNGPVPGHGRST
jgi:hypothetical protein